MTTSSAPTFAAATAVVTEGGERFTAEIDPRWSNGGVASGGYLSALLARAALATSDKAHVVSLVSHFLAAPKSGGVVLEVTPLRRGKGTDQVRVTLCQQGSACAEATVTLGALEPSGSGDPDSDDRWDGGSPPRPVLAYERCERFVQHPSLYPSLMMELIDLRLDPLSMGFMKGSPSGRGRIDGWLALPAAEAFDSVSLVFALDALPPATYDIRWTDWVPTIAFSAYVRALPCRGPVQLGYTAGLVAGNRVDQVCSAWDSDGNLVAQSTQLANVRLGARRR